MTSVKHQQGLGVGQKIDEVSMKQSLRRQVLIYRQKERQKQNVITETPKPSRTHLATGMLSTQRALICLS